MTESIEELTAFCRNHGLSAALALAAKGMPATAGVLVDDLEHLDEMSLWQVQSLAAAIEEILECAVGMGVNDAER